MSASLERGLKVLSVLARAGEPVRFNDLKKELGDIGAASLSRLMKSLVETGYADKNPETGGYTCGQNMAVFANVRKKDTKEALLSTYVPLMKEAAAVFNVTIIMLERVKNILINIHKEQPPYSMAMQEVGNINDDLTEPWMLTLAAYCPEVAEKIKDSEDKKTLSEVQEKGCIYEDQTVRPQVRRFSFPLFQDGEMVGLIGVGGTILQISDEKAVEIIDFISKGIKLKGSLV